MTSAAFSRAPARPALPFLGDLSLTLGRAHELCGPARRTLACLIAARMQGPVFWIAPAWQAERLNAEGVCRLFDPGRISFLDPVRAEDLLWSMEEVLRSGAVPLVVTDLPGAPGIVAIRRLHLAAETGREISGNWPLGLILTPDRGGAPAVETRWHMAGAHGLTPRRAWELRRLRARTEPEAAWQVLPKAGQFTPEPLRVAA